MGSGVAGDSAVMTGHLVEAMTGRCWDPATVTREVSARSARYERRGLQAGDRVCLYLGNRLEFFAELLAVWRLGGCVVPVDGRLTAFEVERLFAAVAPRFVVVDDVIGPAAGHRVDGIEVIDATEPAPPAACAAPGRRPDPVHLGLDERAQGCDPHSRVAPRSLGRARSASRPRILRAHPLPASYPPWPRPDLQQPVPLARGARSLHHPTFPGGDPGALGLAHRRPPNHLPLIGARAVAPRPSAGASASRGHAPPRSLRVRAAPRDAVA